MAIITQGRGGSSNKSSASLLSDEGVLDHFVRTKDSFTGDFPRYDHMRPSLHIEALMPISSSPIKVSKLDHPLTSTEMLDQARKLGYDVSHHQMSLYGKSKFGRARLLSNSEFVNGYGSLYGSPNLPLDERLSILKKLWNTGIGIQEMIKKLASKHSESVANDEIDDANKFSMLRTDHPGQHLGLPTSPDIIGIQYDKEFFDVIDEVIRHYVSKTESLLPSKYDAMCAFVDAKDTAVGGPSFASSGLTNEGYGSHEKRIITLTDMPKVNYNMYPADWLNECYAWGESGLGLPDGSMTFSAYLSYRQGAKGDSPIPLYYFNGSEWLATHEGSSLYSKKRKVYPASHAFNLVITPLAYLMKLFRKMKLGMYHDPVHVAKYVKALNAQGPFSYENDFKSYDTTLPNVLLRYVAKKFAQYSTKYKWEFELFDAFLGTTGVIYPSYLLDDPSYITYFKEAVSLMSGTLPTSEFGSVLSVAANLYTLKAFDKDIVKKWVQGTFIILDQSDDVLFTWPTKIDEAKFESRMKGTGLTAKLKPGHMFLKRMLPVGVLSNEMKHFPLNGVGLYSRAIQNTLANEAVFDGKPDAIFRLGLLSRFEKLNSSPIHCKQLEEAVKDLLSSIPIFEPVVDVLYQSVLSLPDSDKQDILTYSTSEDGLAWISQLIARRDSDPKAQIMLDELSRIGFNISDYDDTSLSQRKSYINAMNADPSSESRRMLESILAWKMI